MLKSEITESLKEKILLLRKNGLTYNEIQKELKCSKGSISKYCSDETIIKNSPPTEKEIQLMQDYYNECKSCNKVAKKFNFCKQTVLKYIITERIKISPEEKRNRGRLRRKLYVNDVKIEAVKYKGGKCEICGYNKCMRALHFHHLNPTKKDFKISNGTKSLSRIIPEIDKCMLVCSNCHCEIHENIDNSKILNDIGI